MLRSLLILDLIGFYRIITYISSPALVCNIGEGIDINVLMLYVFCL